MSNIVETLRRLNERLPLAQRQATLSQPVKKLHRGLLKSLYRHGAIPDRDQSRIWLGEVPFHDAMGELQKLDLVVSNGQSVVGAYPMTLEETPHRVTVGERQLYAMCAIDALAVPLMFGGTVVIESSCAVTGAPVRLELNGERITSAEPGVGVYTGIRWESSSQCAAHSLCREMVFLRDRETALDWRGGDDGSATIMDLPQSIALAATFFRPLLES